MAQIHAKAIIAKAINHKAMMAELEKEMKAIQKEVAKDFDATVKTWEHKPKFDEKFEAKPRRLYFFVGTGDDIYTYVSVGTKPHRIRPKRAKVLRFSGGYQAKSQPGVIDARGGGSSGGEVFSRGVQHPGTKARKFDEAIAEKWQRPFGDRMEKAMKRAAAKSGHAK